MCTSHPICFSHEACILPLGYNAPDLLLPRGFNIAACVQRTRFGFSHEAFILAARVHYTQSLCVQSIPSASGLYVCNTHNLLLTRPLYRTCTLPSAHLCTTHPCFLRSPCVYDAPIVQNAPELLHSISHLLPSLAALLFPNAGSPLCCVQNLLPTNSFPISTQIRLVIEFGLDAVSMEKVTVTTPTGMAHVWHVRVTHVTTRAFHSTRPSLPSHIGDSYEGCKMEREPCGVSIMRAGLSKQFY